ncbi:MAG: HYR domain-containing protein, partial [Candidatus Limnocylindria bacterium]
MSLPGNTIVEATSASGAPFSYTASATDANPATPAVTCLPASGSTFALGPTTVNCSATDIVGNTANGSFTVTVVDTTGPAVAATSDITIEAQDASGAVVTFTTPTASDAVGPASPSVSCLPASGATFALGSTTVTCSATDTAGNLGSNSFTVTVSDTAAPAISVPADQTIEATGPSGAIATFTASASDLVDGALAVTCSPASGSTFALGPTTVNCLATDIAGNTASDSFTVTVRDTTAPAVTAPANVSAQATSASGATVAYSGASATDAVSGSVSTSCLPASGSTFALGSTTVTCSATDDAGNTGTATFTVSVVDTTPPTLILPADDVLEATGPGGAIATFSGSATDVVDGSVTVTCAPASGSTFALGTTTVDCSATDDAGNEATGSFTITVRDTTAPTVTAPADKIVEATGPSGAPVTYSGESASDLVDGISTPSCVPASGSTFALGANTVTCTKTDNAGNTGSDTMTVTVVDYTAPTITVPTDMTVEATSGSGATVTYSASASDLVDGSMTPTCTPASGGTFALGTTTVTCEATDNAGNTVSKTFTITVQDTTAPAITVPANMTVQGTGINGAVVTYSASATDVVDGAVTPVCSPASGSTFAYGTTTVNCTATDVAGNTSSKSFTIRVTYRMSGFYQPVDMNGTLNLVKAGSTVPLKFEIFAGSTELTTTSSIQSFKVSTTNCSTLGVTGIDDIEIYSTGGTTLRYDTTGGQFIQNWQTPKAVGVCYTVTMTAVDGSTIVAYFKT